MTKADFIGMMDNRLKLVRTEYGFTQEKMADVIGISKKTLVEIEKGRRSLGWTGAAACAGIFSGSHILQNDFGGELSDLIHSLAFDSMQPQYPHTMGGRVWWKDIGQQDGYRIQQNLVSLHYRLLDAQDRRIISSFDPEVVRARLAQERKARQ